MHAVDFTRSFLSFRVEPGVLAPATVSHVPAFTVNEARVQIDCCCDVSDAREESHERFVLGASCKTEHVAVPRGLWTEPNADFIPVCSRDRFMHFKTYAQVREGPDAADARSDRLVVAADRAFTRLRIALSFSPATRLASVDEVLDAVAANAPLIGRTTIEEGTRQAVLEYPIKTINVGEQDRYYQVDTGPLLYPDLRRGWHALLEGFELAFAAFNDPGWTEFLIRVPTALTGGLRVHHFGRPVGRAARNEVLTLDRCRGEDGP